MNSYDPNANSAPASASRLLSRGRVYLNWLVAIVLLLLLLLVGVVGYRYDRQMSVIDRIAEEHGRLITDKSGPVWLRATIGDYRTMAFERIEFVSIDNDTSEADVLFLVEHGVPHVEISERRLTGEFGALLARNPQLARLEITSDCPIDAGFLGELSHASSLTSLSFDGGQIHGASLQPLIEIESLESLQELSFRSTDLRGTEFDFLQDMPALQRLTFIWMELDRNQYQQIAAMDRDGLELTFGVSLTDEDLKSLSSMARLEALGFDSDQITDDGLQALANMHGLKFLSLSGYNITDAGLRSLYGLTNLKTVHISVTQVTAEGVSQLQSHLPGVTVYYEPVREFGAEPHGESAE